MPGKEVELNEKLRQVCEAMKPELIHIFTTTGHGEINIQIQNCKVVYVRNITGRQIKNVET